VSEYGYVRLWNGPWHTASARLQPEEPWSLCCAAVKCGTVIGYCWNMHTYDRPPDDEICKRCLAAEEREQ